MTLQRRLALTLVLSAVPLVGGVLWVRAQIARRADVQVLRDIVLSRASAIGRERCEAMPEHFLEGPPRVEHGRVPLFRRPPPEGGPAAPQMPPPLLGPEGAPPPGRPGSPFRPLQAYVYDGSFRPQSPLAPPFPDDLRRLLANGSETASHRRLLDDVPDPIEAVETAVRTGWADGPCAIILARRVGPPASAAAPDILLGAVPLLLGLVAAVWIASGPLVRRVRALTAAVRRSADTRYEAPVPETGRDEITDLARAFNEAGAAVRRHVATLEQRDRTLREFLANTTHDVMIPLTVLQGHLATLQKGVAQGEAIDAEVVVSALQEAQYMSSLVHNLSAAAKLEAPDQLVQRHAVDLNALVERVVERHRPVARAAGVAIDFAVPQQDVVTEGDVTLLEQAVSNVVHNAVRYNRAGGHVAVVLDVDGTSAQGFRLRILDDGPGVSQEALTRLTERRYRDDAARQREPNGYGLGLAIAHEVAERHGLQLHIRQSEQGGLEVEFADAEGS